MEQTLGKRIMEHRKRLGLTQEQLAEKLGVTAQAVSKWENGLSCPDISILPRLAELFGVTTDSLLTGKEEIPVREAEVVTEEPSPDTSSGWEFTWDAGKRGTLGFALLVLALGGQLFAGALLEKELGFWSTLWPTALAVFGLMGMISHFSFFKLGCLVFGGYFLLDNWSAIPFPLGKELIFPAILLIFGISLLVDAMKKPNRPRFRFHRKQNSGKNSGPKNACSYTGKGFVYSGSFGESRELIQLDTLQQGDVSVSFGEYTLDLSGINSLAPNCSLETSCCCGELTLLVPRRFAVKQSASTTFGEFEISGHPDPEPQGILRLDTSTSFGSTKVTYI